MRVGTLVMFEDAVGFIRSGRVKWVGSAVADIDVCDGWGPAGVYTVPLSDLTIDTASVASAREVEGLIR
jgi:hypothetical protein